MRNVKVIQPTTLPSHRRQQRRLNQLFKTSAILSLIKRSPFPTHNSIYSKNKSRSLRNVDPQLTPYSIRTKKSTDCGVSHHLVIIRGYTLLWINKTHYCQTTKMRNAIAVQSTKNRIRINCKIKRC